MTRTGSAAVFDLARTDRLHRRDRGRRHVMLAIALAALASSPAAAGGLRSNGLRSAAFVQATARPQVYTTTGFGHAHGVLRRIEDATVGLGIVDRDWRLHGFGVGVLLADQRIDGHKAIATILHVGGTQAMKARTGLRLVVVDRHGAILGVARPLDRNIPRADRRAGTDQPELLSFDPAYRIASAKLAAIRGVELAPALPTGYLVGRIDGPVGIDQGSSGCGWYDRDGRLLGVTDFVAGGHRRSLTLTGHSLLQALINDAPIASAIDRDYTYTVPADLVGVQGLGAPGVLAQIRSATGAGAPMPQAAAGAMRQRAIGIGYSLGFPMGWRASLAPAPGVARNPTYDHAAILREWQAQLHSAPTGLDDKPGAPAAMRSLANRLAAEFAAPAGATPVASTKVAALSPSDATPENAP